MAETLHATTALGHDTPEAVTIGPWRMTERVDVALASLAHRRGREDDVARIAAELGLPLPPPARAAAGPVLAAFWVAPGMWFVEAPFASHEDIVATLRPAFGEAASITEQTDAWARFDLAGEGLERLFERLCNTDLARTPDGHATRTVIEHLGCYLIRRKAAEVTLYGPRSSAHDLWHAITTAARSVTPGATTSG